MQNAMQVKVSVSDWLQLSMRTRVKLREVFGIPKSRGSNVEMGQGPTMVKSDGTTEQDLQHITIEKMQAFVENTESDYVTLFNASVEKIEEADKELEPQEKPDSNQIVLEEWAGNMARMQMQAQHLGLQEQFSLLISKFKSNDSHNSASAKPAHQQTGKTEKAEPKGTAKGSSKAKRAS